MLSANRIHSMPHPIFKQEISINFILFLRNRESKNRNCGSSSPRDAFQSIDSIVKEIFIFPRGN